MHKRFQTIRNSKVIKNLLAVCFGILLIGLFEFVLAVSGVSPLSDDDPFVGFEGSAPLFITESDRAPYTYFSNPSKKRYFNTQSFIMPKPKNSFRIISFGGSTTYGRPYINNTSFPFWTALLLGKYDKQHVYENINAGGISYASYRVKRLMSELERFSPDLYILYSGHNEFLEKRTFENIAGENPYLRKVKSFLHRSRIYSLLNRVIGKLRSTSSSNKKNLLGEEVEATLEEIGGPELYHRDPVFKEGVIRQYRFNIESIVKLCKVKNIPLVLCTLPSNLSGVSPFKSEHRKGLGRKDLANWTKAFNRGHEAMNAKRYEKALAFFSEAEAIDNEYAFLHFLKGQALLAIGRGNEALSAFNRAKEEDIVPLRALDAFNNIIREVARSEQVVLADIETAFRSLSTYSIPGSNLFADHVHPYIQNQQLIAKLIADQAVKAGIVPLTIHQWENKQADVDHFLRVSLEDISPRYQAMGLWGIGRLFFWAGKYAEAYNALKESWKTVKDIPEIPYQLGKLELYRGNYDTALEYLLAAEKLDPNNQETLFAKAETFLITGRNKEAFQILDHLKQAKKGNPQYHLAMTEAMRLLGKTDEAENELAFASEFAGEIPAIHQQIATAHVRLGNIDLARVEYRKYLSLSRHPDPEQALSDWLRAITKVYTE